MLNTSHIERCSKQNERQGSGNKRIHYRMFCNSCHIRFFLSCMAPTAKPQSARLSSSVFDFGEQRSANGIQHSGIECADGDHGAARRTKPQLPLQHHVSGRYDVTQG